METLNLKTRNFRKLKLNAGDNICVQGPAGTGKTTGFVMPMVEQYLKNEFSGIIYSENNDENFAHKMNYLAWNSKADLFNIDFSDDNVSDRFNPLSPEVILSLDIACSVAQILLGTLSGVHITETESLTIVKAVELAGAAIWFLTKNNEDNCSMPLLIAFFELDVKLQVKLLQSMEDTKELTQEACSMLEATGYERCTPIQYINTFFDNIKHSPALIVMSHWKYPKVRENPKLISIKSMKHDLLTSHKLANLVIFGANIVDSKKKNHANKRFIAVDLSRSFCSEFLYGLIKDNTDNPNHSTLVVHNGQLNYLGNVFKTFLNWNIKEDSFIDKLRFQKKSVANFDYSAAGINKKITLKEFDCGYRKFIPNHYSITHNSHIMDTAHKELSKIIF